MHLTTFGVLVLSSRGIDMPRRRVAFVRGCGDPSRETQFGKDRNGRNVEGGTGRRRTSLLRTRLVPGSAGL